MAAYRINRARPQWPSAAGTTKAWELRSSLDPRRHYGLDMPHVRATAATDDPQSRQLLRYLGVKRAKLIRMTVIQFGGFIQLCMTGTRGIRSDHSDTVKPPGR